MAFQSKLREFPAWLIRHKERIGIVAAGHTAKQVEEILFDWILYGSVSAYFTTTYGAEWGSLATFAAMAPLSAVVCLIYLRMYDWAKIDLFGFEAVKSLGDLETSGGWAAKLVRKMIRLGDLPAFIALSIYSDPFMVTVYLRKGSSQYDGMKRRDWIIFWASVLFSNGYWTLRWTVIIEAVRFLWKLFI